MMKRASDGGVRFRVSRRQFLLGCGGSFLVATGSAALPRKPAGEIIDIHQHTNYGGRTHARLVAHQKRMGVTKTVLLPAGSMFGLEVGCGGNESVAYVARKYPGRFARFANEVPNLPGAREEIAKYLRSGAIGIGEQKFQVPCDSKEIFMVAELARGFGVPVLLHFQHGVYNTGIERFHRVLEKFPDVNFIGHAQTWWGNIDAKLDQKALYPAGPVTPGGLTDRLLSDYPNIYGDFSAGSGLNALTRDEDHARHFIERHQDRLLFGSDCKDWIGAGQYCQGAQILAAIRKLAPSKTVEEKILSRNARRLLRL